MFVALVVLCAGLWLSNPAFLGQSNVVNLTRLISMLGIFTVGIAFVIVTGGIDLSVGSVVGLTGVLIAKMCVAPNADDPGAGGLGYPVGVGIAVGMGAALAIGLAQGLLITRLGLQPFIVTLGFMLLVRGVSQTLVRGRGLSMSGVTVNGVPYRMLANGGIFHIGDEPLIPYTALIFVAVVVVATYLLHFTVFGRYVFAIGGNRDAAEYSGIPVKRVETTTYVISAGLAGLAGVCYAAYISEMSQQVGVAYELTAIAAAVLGGISLRGGEGTIVGILVGVAIMRVIDNGITMFQFPYKEGGRPRLWRLDDNWKNAIIGTVILLAVVLDQVVHMVQARRRTRQAGAAAGAAAAGVANPAPNP
jgi:ribose transport system permease protein